MVVHSTQASLVRSWRRTRGFRLSSGRRPRFLPAANSGFPCIQSFVELPSTAEERVEEKKQRCSGRPTWPGCKPREAIADCLEFIRRTSVSEQDGSAAAGGGDGEGTSGGGRRCSSGVL
ncbi:hypothetical protein HPP92_018355 [Vanilla planifolia]|uniref:Uncharacterized protein n=1 Tax=Vanilla planifolia TaxID=51239 RepID=A0A835UPA9_VANPL|nr:hypothetical protein HPP92_018355 [Vanilla planifolia]